MPYKVKRIIQIEDHVFELHIKGWVTWFSGNARDQKPMTITGKADGKSFNITTSGNNTLGEIVQMILEDLK